MPLRKYHLLSGALLSIFIFAHLANHLFIFIGESAHINAMNQLRMAYKNPLIESLLLISIVTQIITGIKLVMRTKNRRNRNFVDRWQIYSGLYLAVFLFLHVSAVFSGRYILNLDTNLYFGAAGVVTFPFSLFFIPYYFLATLSVFIHISCLIFKLKKLKVVSLIILSFGIIVGFMIIIGMLSVSLPTEYENLFNF